jgi:hypothetical protein
VLLFWLILNGFRGANWDYYFYSGRLQLERAMTVAFYVALF